MATIAQGRVLALRLPQLGYSLIALGALLQIGGGNWDVTWHSLNEFETFSSPPHSVMYLGVALAVVGAAIGLILGLRAHDSSLKAITYGFSFAIVGSILQLAAGGFDFWWHSAFGLDGLLSPPHLMLVVGMVLNGFSASVGLSRLQKSALSNRGLLEVFVTLGFAAFWMSSVGLIFMLTLPFSAGQTFNFNPNPVFSAVLGATVLPLLGPAVLVAGYRILGRVGGILAIGGVYIAVNALANVVAHPILRSTLPFYLLNFLPLLAFGLLLRKYASNTLDEQTALIAGCILGPFYYSMYFPDSVHVYREILGFSVGAFTTLDVLSGTYTSVMLFTAIPSIVLGALGAYLAVRLTNFPLTRRSL